MKHTFKHITLCGLLAVGAGLGMSSCEDFLTITPTNRIVEEEFWQDRRDLNNAVMACYWRLVNGDILEKFVYWGEGRSDNFDRSTETGTTSPTANILNANLLPTYGQFNWTPLYNAINYCNKVLAHGPEVVASDESFSENDWRPIRAEAIALRALCHFYLVRTFGEIPYITEDYNNDTQELRAPQSTQLTVLDNIISDLESVKDDAMSDYGNTVENKGRITKKSVYALLADVYLWRASYKEGNNQPFKKIIIPSRYAGEMTAEQLINRHEDYSSPATSDYQQCINYCDQIIAMAMDEKEESLNKSGKNFGGATLNLELEDLLEPNETETGGTPPSAYNAVFGQGNSDESIFELQVDGTTYSNSMITSLFWNIKDSKAGAYACANTLFKEANKTTGPNDINATSPFTRTDYRRWGTIRYSTSSNTTECNIIKYVANTVTQTNSSTTYLKDNDNALTTNKITQSMRPNSNVNANWIVYRLSEIFLMKAEAMTRLYSDDDNMKEAFNYVRTVFKRSNPYAYLKTNTEGRTDSLNYTNFNTPVNLEKLIMIERQREFIGEGKRWFDLVRYALRRGETSEAVEWVSRRSASNGSAIRAKLADMQSLYSPIYNNEIKSNDLLYQNGVWTLNESSSRTDEM